MLLVLTARASHKILTGGPEVFRALLPALVEAISKPADTDRVASSPVDLVLDPGPKAERPSAEARAGVLFIDVLRGGAPTRRLELAQPVVKIGTHAKAEVRLDPEGDVSRMHAVIEHDSKEAVIIDLGNSAGTWVRGEKVNKAVLRHGDEVRIGDSTLHIGLGAPAQSPPDLLLGPVPTSTAPSASLSSETDDPRTWRSAAMHLYGFESRPPDLFYEIADSILRASEPSRGVRLAKLRRKEGSPKFVVALLGADAAVRAARSVIEAQAAARYRQCAAPPAEIAPDAAYGAETSTHARLRDELGSGTLDVLTTTKIAS